MSASRLSCADMLGFNCELLVCTTHLEGAVSPKRIGWDGPGGSWGNHGRLFFESE
jgi:hypothetical protein